MRKCTICKTEIPDDDKDVFEEQTTFKRPVSPGMPASTRHRPNGLAAHGKCVRGEESETIEQIPGQEPLF